MRPKPDKNLQNQVMLQIQLIILCGIISKVTLYMLDVNI